MATALTRPVRRKVTSGRGEPLVVTLSALGLELREPRRRTSYLLPYGHAFVMAARLFAEQQKREKAAARKARRAAAAL